MRQAISGPTACDQAADFCLSWWQKRDEEVELDDVIWEMSEQRINDLATDPKVAKAYLAERKEERSRF